MMKYAILTLLLAPLVAFADTILEWDPSPTANVTYKVKVGNKPGIYNTTYRAKRETTITIPSKTFKRYAVCVAVGVDGQESKPSNEVEIPAVAPEPPVNLRIKVGTQVNITVEQ